VEGGFVFRDFERHVERALVIEHLSRCRSSRGGLRGELFFGGEFER
jgi:hypothetical protein